jgi:hypothetical protein
MTCTARRVATSAAVVCALVACTQEQEPECPPQAACALPAVTQEPAAARSGSFGGVLEVRFHHDDAGAQDAVATACGLARSTPSPLPPDVRWYPVPDRLDAVIGCLQQDASVRRVTRPL